MNTIGRIWYCWPRSLPVILVGPAIARSNRWILSGCCRCLNMGEREDFKLPDFILQRLQESALLAVHIWRSHVGPRYFRIRVAENSRLTCLNFRRTKLLEIYCRSCCFERCSHLWDPWRFLDADVRKLRFFDALIIISKRNLDWLWVV